ncbi:MAG: SUMF1/EgtB/PvdO family nonheme iron enzyme [Roseiarcus sp.]|jgi:formylglycine-generating enzyme required for sulfatase activity
MAAPVFISHSSRDLKSVRALVDALETRGIACWISERDIAAGDNYGDSIVDAIERASAMVLVFSGAANDSDEIKKEVALASQRRITVVPARIEDATPSKAFRYELATRNWIDIFPDWNEGVAKLGDRLAAIRALPTEERQAPPPAPPPPAPPPPASAPHFNAGYAAGALAALVGVGAILWFALRPPPQPPPIAPTPIASTETPAPPSLPAKAAKPAVAIPVGPPPALAAEDPGGEVFKECDQCPEMVVIPAGKAMLGSPLGESGRQTNEMAPHEVDIDKPLAVGRYAVTFDEWDACFAEGGCGHRTLGDLDFGRGRRPVIFATWNEAQLYVAWLKRKTGQPYRLLSEAEWEYAARGCTGLKCPYAPFWFGAISPEVAVYNWRDSYQGSPKSTAPLKTAPVDSGPPNPFGLYNILGNVRQWTLDCWSAAPAAAPSNRAPADPGDCSARATRGGSWADRPSELRAAARSWETVDEGSEKIGFRVARPLAP